MAVDMMMKNGENDDKVHFIFYIFSVFRVGGKGWEREKGPLTSQGKGNRTETLLFAFESSCASSAVCLLPPPHPSPPPIPRGSKTTRKTRVSPPIVQHVLPLTQQARGQEKGEFLTDDSPNFRAAGYVTVTTTLRR